MAKSLPDLEHNASPSNTEVWTMFDRIAGRYDLLNRMLSFGQDVVWRKRVSKHLPPKPNMRILDVATGTADLIISMFQKNGNLSEGVGVDMAEKMLDVGRKKIDHLKLGDKIKLETGNALTLPFEADEFDALSISFGIRNVSDVPRALSEFYRVLRTDGRVLILEFSLPSSRIMRSLYLFYFRHILPRVGSLISGDSYAYRYLNQTVESFPYGRRFCQLLTDAGFENVAFTQLTFGIATIYQGDKR